MRLILFYLALSFGIGGLLYAFPAFKQFAIKSKRRFIAAVSVPFLIITFVYFMEVVLDA